MKRGSAVARATRRRRDGVHSQSGRRLRQSRQNLLGNRKNTGMQLRRFRRQFFTSQTPTETLVDLAIASFDTEQYEKALDRRRKLSPAIREARARTHAWKVAFMLANSRGDH